MPRIQIGLYHAVAKETVILLGTNVEHAACVVDSGDWIGGGEGGDEFGEVDVGLKVVPEHKGENLEESRHGVFPGMEER